MKIVGKSIKRVDGSVKADGSLKYTDDLEFSGLYGAVVRSSVAYGKILSITFSDEFDFSEFTIVDSKDIEGQNINTILTDDQPFLADDVVKFIGEPILLIAHKDKESLVEAKKHIKIEYEEYEPIFSMEDSLNKKNIIYAKDNIFKTINTQKGKEPNYSKLNSLTKTYTTPHQEQLYLEPQSMIAQFRDGNIRIIGSMQCPFYVESALENLTGKKVEVEQAPTGGAFGGKEDYSSLMASFVYLLSKKSKQDVKLVYNRSEDIAYTTKRHPSKIDMVSYFDNDGKLHGLDIKILIDGGAYCTLSPVVQARAVLHTAGFYDCEYIKVQSNSVATNTPPNGAFRGFGAPQAIFAIERHIDDIAKFLKISPMLVREVNLPTQDSISVTGAKIDEYKRVRDIFTKAREKSEFDKKYGKKEFGSGIGMALFIHGGGFTGVGETLLESEVLLELNRDGKVEIKIASVEMGQGTLTTLPQIVASELEIPLEMVSYHTPNTSKVVNSGPTVASRTIMIVGELLIQTAQKLKDSIGYYGNDVEYKECVKNYLESSTIKQFRSVYKKPAKIKWDEDKFYGNGYDGYSLGCYVAEVEVDKIDYQIKVKNFYAFNDVGKVVNPKLAEGQVEGGVAQGIGFALYEKIVYVDGKIKKPNLSSYIAPLASDLPKIFVDFAKNSEKSKGLGELPMNAPAVAIANALGDALGVEFNSLAITPEIVMEKLCE